MFISLLAVVAIGIVAWFGSAAGFQTIFGVALPYAALVVFLLGFIWRVFNWAKSPVPFRIPTVGGQQRSLDWVKPSRLDSPYTPIATMGRMALEVLTFRSLFRNSSVEITKERGLVQWSSKWLWLFAILFHYAFLVIFIRHFRFFIGDVPFIIGAIETLDGLMQIGVPRFYMSDAAVLGALLFLLGRRLVGKVKYISLPADYFPLFLLIGLTGSGIWMRYLGKTDINSVKAFIMGLVSFSPVDPAGISPLFFMHLCFLSVLLMYFPFSKLMHMGGVFLSPTRNLPNNSRAVHHDNPWNPPKKYRTYAEYEDDFREVMAEAELPLDKEPEEAAG